MADDDVVVVGDGAKKPPPPLIYMRWSSVLKKYVPCDEHDRDAVPYKRVKD